MGVADTDELMVIAVERRAGLFAQVGSSGRANPVESLQSHFTSHLHSEDRKLREAWMEIQRMEAELKERKLQVNTAMRCIRMQPLPLLR